MSKFHAYKQFSTDISADRMKQVVLLYGKEQFLANWASGQLLDHYVSPPLKSLDFVRIDGEKATAEDIITNCETLPLGSARRGVLVVGADDFFEEKSKHGAGRGVELAEYITAGLPETCLLIFLAHHVDRRKKLFKAITALGNIYDFEPLDLPQLKGFIEKRFRSGGKRLTSSALHAILENTGYLEKDSAYTLYHLDNDITGILAYAEQEDILASDVAAVISTNIETNVFALTDAVSRGRGGDALQLLNHILADGEHAYKLIALLFSQFETILKVKELQGEGATPAVMKSKLGIHEFRIKKAAEFSRRYALSDLQRILHFAYEIDKQIKTGLLRDEIALELFVSKTTKAMKSA